MPIKSDFGRSLEIGTTLDVVDNATAKMMRDYANSPAAKMMQDYANSPAAKMMQDYANSPAAKMMQDYANSPAAKMMRDYANSPAAKMMQDYANSPAAKMMRDYANSPAAKMMRDYANSPAVKMMRDYANSPAVKMMRDYANSPAVKMMRDYANSPAVKMMRDYANSPAMKMIQDYANSPAMGLAASAYRHAGMPGSGALAAALAAGVSAVTLSQAELFESLTKSMQSLEVIVTVSANDNKIAILDWLLDVLGQLYLLVEKAGSALESTAALRLATIIMALVIPMVASHIDLEIARVGIEKEISEHSVKEDKSDNELKDKLQKLDEELAKLNSAITRKSENEKDKTFYIAIRTVPLCQVKRFHCTPIIILAPGVEVQLLERSGKWIRVAAVVSACCVDEGWVLKKYLRIRK